MGTDAAATTRLVLFDLDGTFADTLPDLAAAMDRTLVEAGRAPLGPDGLRPVVSLGARRMIERAFPDLREADALDRHRRYFLAEYHARVAELTRPFAGISPLVEALEARGVRWGIVTNKLARWTDPLLTALPIARRAACVVSGDSAARAKPAPDPLLLACERAGVAPAHAVYVGDSPIDVESARAAGMPVFVAAWGYLPDGDDPADWGADAVLAKPGALLERIDAGPHG